MAKDENNAQGGQEGGDGKNDPNSDLYEAAGPKKILRLFTVVAYMGSVSFMGVALSAYYLFLWEPPNPRLIQRTHHLSAEPQAESLIGEPRLNSNNSVNQLASETYSGYVPSNLVGDSVYLQNTRSNSQMPIGGWNVGEQLSEDGTMNNNHTKMNESLVLLRNSLIDILKPNRTDVPLRTISGSESGKDRLASGKSEWDSSRINHLNHNSIVTTDFTDDTVEGKASTTFQPIKRKRKFRRREAPDSKNLHKEVDSILLSDKKILLHTKRDQVQEADQSEVSPGWQTSSPKLISIAITYGDTQIDTMTTPSMTEEDDQPGELGTGGILTETDVLTTLAESVLFGRIYFSNTTWSDSEYTQSSPIPDTIENNSTNQSIVFSME